jgi:hypothetical protein
VELCFSSTFSLAFPFAVNRIVAPYRNVSPVVWLVSLNEATSVKSSLPGFLWPVVSGQVVSCFCPGVNESSELLFDTSVT